MAPRSDSSVSNTYVSLFIRAAIAQVYHFAYFDRICIVCSVLVNPVCIAAVDDLCKGTDPELLAGAAS